MTRDGQEYCIIKGSIHQENIAIINVYAPKKQCCKIGDTKIDRTDRKNKQLPNYSWSLQPLSVTD